jgi:hypothetical protein
MDVPEFPVDLAREAPRNAPHGALDCLHSPSLGQSQPLARFGMVE